MSLLSIIIHNTNNFMLIKHNKSGFTLVELLVVLVIAAMLATLSIIAIGQIRQKSRDVRRVSDIKQIQTALELYFYNTGSYPNSDDFHLGDTLESDGTTYMHKVPLAPYPSIEGACKINQYLYEVSFDNLSYKLYWCLASNLAELNAGTCVASPTSICSACNQTASCDGKCGGHDGCGVICPSTCSSGQTCDTATNTCHECSNNADCASRDDGKNTCSDNSCICVATTDDALKAAHCSGKDCGSIIINDNCGTSRTVLCGPNECSDSYQSCGGGGIPNVCGCTKSSIAQACSNYCNGKQVADGCGDYHVCDNLLYCNTQVCCKSDNTCGSTLTNVVVVHNTECVGNEDGHLTSNQKCMIFYGIPTQVKNTGYSYVNSEECFLYNYQSYWTYTSFSQVLYNRVPVEPNVYWYQFRVTCNFTMCN